MENKNTTGLEKLIQFSRTTPQGMSKFDYFNLLDHISHCKIDKEGIINIFNESILNY